MAEEYDGIILGAGPNGLTVAAYLAKAGLRILLLEKRFEAGGGLATEQVTLPGFLHNTHAVYMPMVDYAPPLKDFEEYLSKDYDLEIVFPSLVMAMPLSGRRENLRFHSTILQERRRNLPKSPGQIPRPNRRLPWTGNL
jgi:phytoene dehydrogenase-like protein